MWSYQLIICLAPKYIYCIIAGQELDSIKVASHDETQCAKADNGITKRLKNMKFFKYIKNKLEN
jgi:hypothetical protein